MANFPRFAQNIDMNRKNTFLYAVIVVVVFLATQLFAVCQSAVTPVAVFASQSENGVKTAEEKGAVLCSAAVSDEEKSIYLTFDDGPSDRVTPKILDVLKEEGVKATFFIVGKSAETRRYIVKREYEEGHCVAVHSYSHEYGDIYSSPKELMSDIDKCNKLIYEVTGEYSTVYRFPGGSFTVGENFIAEVISKGMRYVDWNASTRDAEIYNRFGFV